MNANAEYFENLALFARANNQARRRVSEEFTVTNSEDYRETHMPTSHTLSKQIPATGFDHWDLVSDWHRLSQEKREFEELKRETFEKIASAQEGLISDCDKLSRAQNEFQETKQEMGQALMDLRRDNMMLQRDLYVASIIMSFFAVICFAQRVGLVPQQYEKSVESPDYVEHEDAEDYQNAVEFQDEEESEDIPDELTLQIVNLVAYTTVMLMGVVVIWSLGRIFIL